jgi:hypothetical protein
MAKTLKTFTVADWTDLAGTVKFVADIITGDEESYPEDSARLERVRALLAGLRAEWEELRAPELQGTIVR